MCPWSRKANASRSLKKCPQSVSWLLSRGEKLLLLKKRSQGVYAPKNLVLDSKNAKTVNKLRAKFRPPFKNLSKVTISTTKTSTSTSSELASAQWHSTSRLRTSPSMSSGNPKRRTHPSCRRLWTSQTPSFPTYSPRSPKRPSSSSSSLSSFLYSHTDTTKTTSI